MDNNYLHVNGTVRKQLNDTDENRIQRIKSQRWIGHGHAHQIMAELNALIVHPQKSRMPNLLIVGDTNSGKTTIIKRFCSDYLPEDDPKEGTIKVPVMYIQMPPVPDEGRFYEAMLDFLFAPYRARDSIGTKQRILIRILKTLGVRMLIIDEFQHVLAGRANQQRTFLNALKYIGNELMIPIVAGGTKESLRAIQIDPQLENRFKTAALPKWQMDLEFRKLLASFERLLPLKEKSDLAGRTLAPKLHYLSNGVIGELSELLNIGAELAIRMGIEKINDEVLEEVKWIPPGERRIRARELLD